MRTPVTLFASPRRGARWRPILLLGLPILSTVLATQGLGPLRAAASVPVPTSGRSAGFGTVSDWGNNIYGQIGDGTTTNRANPVAVPGPTGVRAIAAGAFHATALSSDGTVTNWGDNNSGELGLNAACSPSPCGGTPAQVHGPGNVGFLTGVTAIADAQFNTYAVRRDSANAGTVFSWGQNDTGQLGNNATNTTGCKCVSVPVQVVGVGGTGVLSGVSGIAGGYAHGVVIKGGAVYEWGLNANGQLGNNLTTNTSSPVQVVGVGGTGTLTGVTSVAAGFYFTLALKSDGTVWAWGQNNFGQLGQGTTNTTGCSCLKTPVQVKGVGGTGFLTGVRAIASHGYHALALMNDGSLYSWGENNYGQLGVNSLTNSSTPVQVQGVGGTGFLTGIASINAGEYVSQALMPNGTVYSWGPNDEGDLAQGTFTSTGCLCIKTPVLAKNAANTGTLVGVSAIATFAYGGMAIMDPSTSTVQASGSNATGQLGNGTTVDQTTPSNVTGLSGVTQIAAGGAHSVALRSDGTVWAWGDNTYGQLGDGTQTARTAPVQVCAVGQSAGCSVFLTGVVAIAAGQSHTVALMVDGTVTAWGRDDNGQLGTGLATAVRQLVPAFVCAAGQTSPCGSSLAGVTAIAASWNHSVALTTVGEAWGWGENQYGQVGDGTTIDVVSPAHVCAVGQTAPCGTFSTGIRAIAAGTYVSLALNLDGTVNDWGDNSFGQLGNGSFAASIATPVAVSGLSTATAVSGGDHFNMAQLADGAVWSWGLNTDGQIGDGTTTQRNTPAQVCATGQTAPCSSFLTGATAIAAGNRHGVVATSDGSVWSWGQNTFGQLGQQTNTGTTVPAQVVGITGATAVAANDHSLTIAVYSCTGGSLVLNSGPASISFPGKAVANADQTDVASGIFALTDLTTAAAGWNIQATSTSFSSGAHTLPTTATTVTGWTSAARPGNCSAPTTATIFPSVLPAGATPPLASRVYVANSGTGRGPLNLTLNFGLKIPSNSFSGSYSSSWTFTIASGP